MGTLQGLSQLLLAIHILRQELIFLDNQTMVGFAYLFVCFTLKTGQTVLGKCRAQLALLNCNKYGGNYSLHRTKAVNLSKVLTLCWQNRNKNPTSKPKYPT